MGILSNEIEAVKRFSDPLAGKRMLELGSQQIMCCAPTIPEGSSAKDYWLQCGVVEHVSIDLNGERGSLTLDLGAPVELSCAPFDIVTDFGTTEHVYNFYEARANAHRLCVLGGIMFFQNPLANHWPDHGLHYFMPFRLSDKTGPRDTKVTF